MIHDDRWLEFWLGVCVGMPIGGIIIAMLMM